MYRVEHGVVPPDLKLTFRHAYDRSDVYGFWHAWSKGAEEGLFRTCCWAGGPTTAGVDAFFGRGAVRFRRRRLGGESVRGGRGTGAGRLYRAGQGDVVDASSAQYFVNSSLAPVLLFRWRLKSVADVSKVLGSVGSLRQGGMLFKGTGELCVVRALVVQCVTWSPRLVGFSRTFMASANGSLTLLGGLRPLLSR